jgi:endo-1,4-beta-xylanase
MFMNKFYAILCVIAIIESCNSPEENKNPALHEATDIHIGTAISANDLIYENPLKEIALHDFDSYTMENDMKMRRIARSENDYHWEVVDSVVAFCEKNNKRLHGHVLIWHSSIPDWLKSKDMEAFDLNAYVEEYITTYVSRYKGKIAGWDVVNEAISDSAGTMRQTFWLEHWGKNYIDKAFRMAHAADPEAVLFYNDYNIERDTAKLHATLHLVENLLSEGVPIHGIGLQMHIRMDVPNEIMEYAIRKCAETGLKVHLSELDLIFNKHDDSRGGGIQKYTVLTDSMAQAQGEKYRQIAEMYKRIVPEDQQYGITVWGFDDAGTWIRGFFDIVDWPTLYNDSLERKPAYYGFLEGLKKNIREK